MNYSFSHKPLITFLLLMLSSIAHAQISGIVVDRTTGERLAFAHVVVTGTQQGTLTDIDGRFVLKSENISSVTISYVGYENKTMAVSPGDDIRVLMESSGELLKEIVILEGENPAIPILEKAIANKKQNNPENLPWFSLETYNKFVISAIPRADDSSKEAAFIRESNLFLMESVTEKVYRKPGKYAEKVVANRVSGFKNPTFTTLANGIQPFSFYDDYILLLGTQFTNPLGKPGMKEYNYYLEDSISSDYGKIYVILFEAKSKDKEELTGFLHISDNQWALENVIARTENYSRPASQETEIAFQIQQKYQLIGRQWFPAQLNTSIRILSDDDETIEGTGRTYLKNIDLQQEITKKQVGRVVLSFDQKANKRDNTFWQNNRLTPLSEKEIRTYEKIDSLGKENNFDRILIGLNALTTGQIKMGKVGLDLNRLINFNRYEGFRLGAGVHTNRDFSGIVTLGGYFGYGFKDRDWKYGSDLKLSISDENDLTFIADYHKDVRESGGLSFFKDDNAFSFTRDRKLLIDNMDIITSASAGLSFYWLKFLDTEISLTKRNVQTTTGYLYSSDELVASQFDLTEASLRIRYAPNLQYAESFFSKLPVYDHQPVIWFNLTRGSNLFEGDFNYTKLAFKMLKSSKFRKFGSLRFTALATKVFGEVPYPVLFNGYGTYYSSFGLETRNGFQTMRFNEFLSDEFYGLLTDIYIGSFTLHKKWSKPAFEISHNMGWGRLDNRERHQNYDFSTLEDGFLETGLSITDVIISNFSGFGIGIYYRYGANGFEKPSDNLVFKFNTSINLK